MFIVCMCCSRLIYFMGFYIVIIIIYISLITRTVRDIFFFFFITLIEITRKNATYIHKFLIMILLPVHYSNLKRNLKYNKIEMINIIKLKIASKVNYFN